MTPPLKNPGYAPAGKLPLSHCVLAVLTSSSGFSPSTESDQEREDSLRIDTSSDVLKVGSFLLLINNASKSENPCFKYSEVSCYFSRVVEF